MIKGVKNKKAQELVPSKVIAAILVLLVIVVLLFIIAKPQILDWIRNLPSYKTPEDKEVDYTSVSTDDLAKYWCGSTKDAPALYVAKIGDKDLSYRPWRDARAFYIYSFNSDGTVKAESPKQVMEVYFDMSKTPPSLYHKSPYLFSSITKIGTIQNNHLVLNEKARDYLTHYEYDLVSNSYLSFRESGRIFCKSKKELETIFQNIKSEKYK